MQGNPGQSWILDSTTWTPEIQLLGFSLCFSLGFSGAWPRSPDSTSTNFPDSGFLNEKFPGLWNQDSLKLGELLRGNHTTFLG